MVENDEADEAGAKFRLKFGGAEQATSLHLVLPSSIYYRTSTIFNPSTISSSVSIKMSLVSGPGHAPLNTLPTDLTLSISAHVKYIQSLDTRRDELEYWLTEHLRMNGLYWGL